MARWMVIVNFIQGTLACGYECIVQTMDVDAFNARDDETKRAQCCSGATADVDGSSERCNVIKEGDSSLKQCIEPVVGGMAAWHV